MYWKSILKSIGLLSIFVFIMACSLGAAAPTVTQESVNTETPPAATLATEAPTSSGDNASQCANQYYPVRQGAKWSYTSTGSIAGNYSFTDSITAVRADGFTLTTQFDKLTRTQEWSCKPEGLLALQLGGGALVSENVKLQVDTQNASGVTYPAKINAGDEWDYSLDFTGTMEIAGNPGNATGNDKVHFTALGLENVTVPAGTFDAMKIQEDTTLNINVTIQGLSVPVVFTSSYIYWYAPNVGYVKGSGKGSIAAQSFSEEITLQSYSIP